jgi:SAM-dependent methyltransferase
MDNERTERRKVVSSTPSCLETARSLFEKLFGRVPNSDEVAGLLPNKGCTADWSLFVRRLMLSTSGIESELRLAMDLHLHLIHGARLKMVQLLLPAGDIVLDLGGANAPLYRMGYRHPFKQLFLIDLPEDHRHQNFRDVCLERGEGGGEIVLRYADMTDLRSFADESVDFVWSGQSIEHVTPERGAAMCSEAYRVLKPGGSFCLDTPNGLVTRLHANTAGLEFIHPDHKVEYTPAALSSLLEHTGFRITARFGICEMPLTASTGKFAYEDFVIGGAVSLNMESSYIQFFNCTKMRQSAGWHF